MKARNEEIIIRQMEINDAFQVAKLDKICFAEAWSLESFKYELTENIFARYFVAENLAGEIVAYAGLWEIIDEGHITNVAVIPEYRGFGVGMTIVEKILAESLKDGIKSFTLEVRRSNDRAINLYKKFGFKEEGTRKAYYQDNNEDAIIMWKHID